MAGFKDRLANKLHFTAWSLKARFDKKHDQCPYCQSTLHATLQKKHLLLEARKCHFCGLIFRWPTTTDMEAAKFYQEEYQSGIVTDLPDANEMKSLKENNFKGSRFDKTAQVEIAMKAVAPPARALVFGSSWGYTDYQLKRAGYQVEGLELSKPRAEFGIKNLGLTIHTSWEKLLSVDPNPKRFDLIFTAHTMEHLTDVRGVLSRFQEVAAPYAKLIIIVPNGGGEFARTQGVEWAPFVGTEHTIAYTSDWFGDKLKRHGCREVYATSTTPEGQYDESCNGDGLMVIGTYS